MEFPKTTYYNQFFENIPKLPSSEVQKFKKGRLANKKPFQDDPFIDGLVNEYMLDNRDMFYFLPFLINCYEFTKRHHLPYFTLMCSPTFLFYRDRLHLRNFMDTIHQSFFRMMDVCLKKDENIMLLVEKRFHIENPVDGGTQQLYNMLWDYDLDPPRSKVILPPQQRFGKRLGLVGQHELNSTSWGYGDLNPGIGESGLDLSRRTLWLEDDLNFLCKRYDIEDEYHSTEEIDLSNVPEEKWDIYRKTAREFYFKVFMPKDASPDVEVISSDSELEDVEEIELDSTGQGLLDSTLDFEEDEKEMNKIIAFFAKMPKVTGLVQGMVDMMESLTRILPLVIVKLDDDKLKGSLKRTVDIINLGLGKVLKICAYLGIKVQKKPNGAIGEIVKNRFKKDKKDFLEYEIDELNKSLDSLENVDAEPPKPPKGQIPLDVKPNHLYPQRMPLRPMPPPPIVVPPEPPPVPVKPPHHPPKPPEKEADSSGSELKPEPPPIPSVMPEPPNHPPKNENGI